MWHLGFPQALTFRYCSSQFHGSDLVWIWLFLQHNWKKIQKTFTIKCKANSEANAWTFMREKNNFFINLNTRATLSLMSSQDMLHSGVPPVTLCCCLINSASLVLVVLPWRDLWREPQRWLSSTLQSGAEYWGTRECIYESFIMRVRYLLFCCHWVYWSRSGISACCCLCLGQS